MFPLLWACEFVIKEVRYSMGRTLPAGAIPHGAWHILKINNYDLLITDQNMPKVSGVELVRKLRAARMA